MNIIVVGCGKVGEALTHFLLEEGNDITVIDTDKDKVQAISERFDVMGIVGNGATRTILREANIDDADLLIAVTGSDELNLLCCLIAKKAGDCRTIARVRSPQYSQEASYIKDELGLAMVINPEWQAAREIARVLRFPWAIKVDTFSRGRVELFKFRLPEGSSLAGKKVKDIVSTLHCDVMVCTIERNNEAYIANGDFVFQERDVISAIAEPKNAEAFFKKINYKVATIHNVMIVGAGRITHYLCTLLEDSNISVKVIEREESVCETMDANHPEVTVIHADAVDQQVLLEEGVANIDAFVTLTNMDEENILLSLFVRSMNPCKLVTKINRVDYGDVISHLDLDSIVYPKQITAETIARYVRAMNQTVGSDIETLYQLIKGKVEVAEYVIKGDSALVGIPLSKLQLKDGVLIAAILRDRKCLLPRGGDIMKIGDAVVIVTNHLALQGIEDILK